MHDLGGGICEMKRMFVDPQFRGKGIGRALATRLIEVAREAGYTRMRLETSRMQIAAQGLYRSLGFQGIERYDQGSEVYRACDVFMELSLLLPLGVAARKLHPPTEGGLCR
jgi:ribosomal protein S18 acetylase RimI-like enzyme